MHENLDILLKSRVVPEARSNLTQRIIDASLQDAPPRVQAKLEGLGRWVQAFLDGFALPQPALALSLALLVGIGMGFFDSADMVYPDFSTDDFSLALNVDELLDTGDFL